LEFIAAIMSNPKDELILEGIVVTVNATGEANIAPMGPRITRDQQRLVLRPFQTSRTYQNIKATGVAVFHITDDVLLLAQAAMGNVLNAPLVFVEGFACPRLSDTCRWLALRSTAIDESSERTHIECDIVQSGEVRPFFGFNRAKHAVIEAAILATRIGILPHAEIQEQLQRLAAPVNKTAGDQEHAAFTLLQQYINDRLKN
jgi:hypothetical protein